MPLLPKNIEEIKQKPMPETVEGFQDLVSVLFEYTSRIEEDNRLLRGKVFGRSSERYVNPAQPSLFDEPEHESSSEELDEDEELEVPAHKRKKRRKQLELPENLERDIRTHELTGEELNCSCCGEAMGEIGEDCTEKIDIIPASVKVIKDVYKKYSCKNSYCDGTPKQASRVPVAIPKIKATESTLAHIAIQKYQYALPLYRMEMFFKAIDVPLSRAVMSMWMIKLAEALKPIYEILERRLLAEDYIHMDETRVQVLNEPDRAATSKSYMWVRTTDISNPNQIALFNYDPSRSAAVAENLLTGFEGFLQTDDYSAYPCAIKLKEIIHLLCWDHARRYFSDAFKAISEKNRPGTVADQVLKLLKKLYKIERRAKEMSFEERKDARQKESLPVLEKIKTLCEEKLPTLSGSSKTAKAINYMIDNWDKLLIYTENGRLNISNSPAEQVIRPFAIGRKNWLFSTSQAGAESSGILYSIIQTARANDIDPYIYIKSTLLKIPYARTIEDLERLLPFKEVTVH